MREDRGEQNGCAEEKARSLRYARILSTLIQVPTVSVLGCVDADRFRAFHRVLRETFPHIFAVCEVEDFEGSLLLCWHGADSSKQPVLILNHMDVVEPNGSWTDHEPFSGDIAAGKVWGRGALDNKCSLFGMLQAADELAEQGFVPSSDIYFVSTCTEETSGSGCQAIARELQDRGVHFRFSLDEGGFVIPDLIPGSTSGIAVVGVGEKTNVSIRFTASGDGGHASMPGADTPLIRLGRFMAAADKAAKSGKLFRVWASPAIKEMMRRAAPCLSGPVSFAASHPDFFAPLLKTILAKKSATAASLLRTTVAFTMAQGSDADNVLPTEAWVVANIRCSHHQGVQESIDALIALARRFGLQAEIIDSAEESPIGDFRSEGFGVLEAAYAQVCPGVVVVPFVTATASDSRFLGSICDLSLRNSPYVVTMGQIATVHSVDENIDVDTLAAGVDVYKRFMTLL